MSHYREIRTTLNDRESLVEALKILGLTAEVHDAPVRITNRLETRHAHVVLRLDAIRDAGFASYGDIGWYFNDDGTVDTHVDTYPVFKANGERSSAQEILDALPQAYAEARVMKVMRQANVQNGQVVSREKQPDGSVRIVIGATRDVQKKTSGRTGIVARKA